MDIKLGLEELMDTILLLYKKKIKESFHLENDLDTHYNLHECKFSLSRCFLRHLWKSTCDFLHRIFLKFLNSYNHYDFGSNKFLITANKKIYVTQNFLTGVQKC